MIMSIIPFLMLFLSEENLHRAAEEIELAAQFVLKESLVWVADVLRKVAEERE